MQTSPEPGLCAHAWRLIAATTSNFTNKWSTCWTNVTNSSVLSFSSCVHLPLSVIGSYSASANNHRIQDSKTRRIALCLVIKDFVVTCQTSKTVSCHLCSSVAIILEPESCMTSLKDEFPNNFWLSFLKLLDPSPTDWHVRELTHHSMTWWGPSRRGCCPSWLREASVDLSKTVQSI